MVLQRIAPLDYTSWNAAKNFKLSFTVHSYYLLNCTIKLSFGCWFVTIKSYLIIEYYVYPSWLKGFSKKIISLYRYIVISFHNPFIYIFYPLWNLFHENKKERPLSVKESFIFKFFNIFKTLGGSRLVGSVLKRLTREIIYKKQTALKFEGYFWFLIFLIV